MRLSRDESLAIALRAAGLVPADAAEVVVSSQSSALTRFAGNRIHQNVAETGTQVAIRAVIGSRTGSAETNRLDEASLVRCAAAAAEAARHAPEDPGFPGLPGPAAEPAALVASDPFTPFGADARAEAAREIIGHSVARSLTAAGTVAANDYAVAVANTLGVAVATEAGDVRATVLSMGSRGGSGWASFLGRSAVDFLPSTLGEQAAETAVRSEDPGSLDPGAYTVVLAPEAVSDILDFTGYLGFGAKSYAEGGSFLAEALGTEIADSRVSIADDATHPQTIGLPFDFEGQPRGRTPLIEAGIARGPVTDSYYAARLGVPNTGHALPAPNPYGPLPLNIVMEPGHTSLVDMVASVDRGVYVSRFHYVNVEDPMKLVLTGMTRDGTFMIEGGEITTPLRNLRFTQSVLEAFRHVVAIGSERALFGPGEGGATLVPAMLIDRWAFTGQTG